MSRLLIVMDIRTKPKVQIETDRQGHNMRLQIHIYDRLLCEEGFSVYPLAITPIALWKRHKI